jgi:hypothetical protein
MDDTLENGLKLFAQENYSEAMKILLPAAESGNPLAQSKVGLAYQLGLTGPRNLKNAIKWLTMAADQGFGDAAHNLGTLYLTCEPDMSVDREKSRQWYEKAKTLGFIVGTEG